MSNYTLQTFSSEDIYRHDARIRKSWWLMAFVFGFIGIMLLVLLMTDRYKNVREMVLAAFGVVYLILGLMAVPMFRKMYRDKAEQQKYCGEFPAKKTALQARSTQKFTLHIPTQENHYEISLTEQQYNRLVPTIPVWVEFSRHSATLLKLRQQGMDIQL